VSESLPASPLPAAAAVIPVRPGGDILLMLRDDRPDLPNANCWATIGGAVEPGETPAEGAAREVEEELGQKIPALTPVGTIDGVRFRSFVFATQVRWALDDLILGEGQGVDWLGRDRVTEVPLARGVGPAIRRFLDSDTYRELATGAAAAPPLTLPPLPVTLMADLGLAAGGLLAVRGATAAFVRRAWDVLNGVRITASPAAHERPDALLWWPRAERPAEVLGEWSRRLTAGGAIWAVAGGSDDYERARTRDRLCAAASRCGLRPAGLLDLPQREQAIRLTRDG
jgi:8-oxo-dGTP pyrophosphatase MutT (NUDIX family)